MDTVIMTPPLISVAEAATAHDREMAEAIRESILHDLWIDATRLGIQVRDGIVYLHGRLDRRTEKELVEKWAATVDGAVGVESRLTYEVNDRET